MTVLRLLAPQDEPEALARRAPKSASPELPPAVTASRPAVLARYLLWSFAIVLVLGATGALALHRVATQEALSDAEIETAALGHSTIRPEISAALLRGDDGAIADLDQVVRERVLREPIVRVKVWTTDGRIVYSDAAALIGERHPLRADLREAPHTDEAESEISDLGQPENRFERSEGKLVEVYLPLTSDGGQRVIFETYRRASSVDAASRRLLGAFLPILIVLLVVLAAAQLPLGAFLARRVRHQELEQEQFSRRTDAMLEAERLRIAADLHDGVIQDLAGTGYELQAVGARLPIDPLAEAGDDLRTTILRGAQACRDSVRALRVLLVDLHPRGERPPGLGEALDILAGRLRMRGLHVDVSVDVAAEPPPDVGELIYRGAQEGLRNVERHADARSVQVMVRDGDGVVVLSVADDGRGMTEADLEDHITDGHMGLRLLADCVAARGGWLQIESEPLTGTRLSLQVPEARPGEPLDHHGP